MMGNPIQVDEDRSFTAMCDGIRAAIIAASRIPVAEQVVWQWQDAPQPDLDYIAIGLGTELTMGLDMIVSSYDPARPAGREIELRVKGSRETALEVKCYTAIVDDQGNSRAADGSNALALAMRTKAGLMLPSVRQLLTKVAVSPFDPGQVNYVPEIVNAGFRARAICTIRCYMPAPFVAEYVTYIQTVRGTATVTGGAQTTNTRDFGTP